MCGLVIRIVLKTLVLCMYSKLYHYSVEGVCARAVICYCIVLGAVAIVLWMFVVIRVTSRVGYDCFGSLDIVMAL